MVFRPHDYQRHCIGKIIEIKKIGLFLDMGLGKTVTTLTAIRELKYNRFQVRRAGDRAKEGGGGHVDPGKGQMGPHPDAAGVPGAGEPGETGEGPEHPG